MKKSPATVILATVTMALANIAIAQENNSTPEKNAIEGLYLGMAKAAAEEKLASFCLKTGGSYKQEQITGDYDIIFAEITRCKNGDEYLNIRSALDKVYDISKSQYIDVEGNYEHSDMLLDRAKAMYGKPDLETDRRKQDGYLVWEMNSDNYSQLPKNFQEHAVSYVKADGFNSAACWGKSTLATVDNYTYIRSGDKAMCILLTNDRKLFMKHRMTDFEIIDNAWHAYQESENEQINAEKAANKSIIDNISF